MDIGKPISEYKQQLQDGLSYMDDMHANISEETMKRLTSTIYVDKVHTYGHAGANRKLTVRTPSLGVDNEHLINVAVQEGEEANYDVNRSTAGQYGEYDKKNKAHTPTDIKVSKEQYESFLQGSTLSNPETMLKNRFSRFSRYGYIDLSGEFLTGTREYLFFSKPDLHLLDTTSTGGIYEQLKSNSFLTEAYYHYRYSFYSLQQSFGESLTGKGKLRKDSKTGIVSSEDNGIIYDTSNLYIPLLSNMATSTLDLGDITANDVENNKNIYQVNTTYRESSYTSDMAYDFSIEFKDTKYLDVYMLFKIYDEYCRHKYFAEIEPVKDEYIINKIYPEAFSIWKIIVDDTDRIIYWAKAIGVTPMSVPRGAMSNFDSQIKLTINFKAQFVKDMDPMNLFELNNLTQMSIGKTIDDIKIALPSGGETWVGYPYVLADSKTFHTHTRTGDTGANGCYKLIWIA